MGSIPSIAGEYQKLKEWEKNRQERKLEDGKVWYDYVTDIDYGGHKINMVEYGEHREQKYKKGKKKGRPKTARKKGGGEENQGTTEETADKVQGDFAA